MKKQRLIKKVATKRVNPEKGFDFCWLYLANVAERGLFGRRMEKRETLMLGGELVRVVDAAVAVVTESCLVGGAEHRSLVFGTDITQDLHLHVRRLG